MRSEKDPFTLMRMIQVNIFNTDKTLKQCITSGVKKYFCVSTDKAANPVNMMGASKRIMEMFVNRRSKDINVSMARFANVAFSDGSLLHGFNQRLAKNQPIVAPNDIKRYFVIPKESGELCLMSCIFGDNRDIYFPKLSENLHLITFADIAVKYLEEKGLKPYICKSEDEARDFFKLTANSQEPKAKIPAEGPALSACTERSRSGVEGWPCYFTKSDTTGEKDFEEFFTENEVLDMNRYENLGIIKNSLDFDEAKLNMFTDTISMWKKKLKWDKPEMVELFHQMIPDFGHKETGKYLDGKM